MDSFVFVSSFTPSCFVFYATKAENGKLCGEDRLTHHPYINSTEQFSSNEGTIIS